VEVSAAVRHIYMSLGFERLSIQFYILYYSWICRRISIFPKCPIYDKIKKNF